MICFWPDFHNRNWRRWWSTYRHPQDCVPIFVSVKPLDIFKDRQQQQQQQQKWWKAVLGNLLVVYFNLDMRVYIPSEILDLVISWYCRSLYPHYWWFLIKISMSQNYFKAAKPKWEFRDIFSHVCGDQKKYFKPKDRLFWTLTSVFLA